MKIKEIIKKWGFWVIIILLILFAILFVVPYIILNNICWSSATDGYKNIETGECEIITGCFRHNVPEGYIFDEECWTNSTSAQYWERNKLGLCETWCDKNICREGTRCAPICEIYC